MSKKTAVLLLFILLKFLCQYHLVNPYYDLQRDEFLHLDQANHLAWGYLSVPPFTSWVAWIIKLLGSSVFWIRFFPALFGAFTMVVVWKAIEELKGNLFACILGATCLLLSVLIRLNLLFQPNSFDVLCWTACYYFLIKYLNSNQSKWLLMCAVAFAIGFLNKYNICFLFIGLLPAILLTEQRSMLVQKKLFLAVLLCLLIISPNLIWQYNNHFPVFHHMQKLAATQLVHVSRIAFLKEVSFYFIGAVPVIVSAWYALLFYAPFKKYKCFFWAFIFTLAVFIFLRAKSYYAIGLFPIYLAFGSVYLADVLSTGWKKYLRPVVILIPVLFYVLLFRVVYSIESPQDILKHEEVYQKLGLLRWEDGKNYPLPQDFADMLGWKELAEKVDIIYAKLPANSQTLILCDNYGQAGAINYYTKNKNVIALSFSADYIDWLNADAKFDNLIRVKDFDGSENEMKTTKPFFEAGIKADSIANPLAREYGTAIFVFCKAKIDISQRIRDEKIKIRKEFR
jgi:dolichyl-phosphate-mannose-protein mannosyltransferase